MLRCLMNINLKSPIPLHLQVKLILEDEIMKNQYDGKIPGEMELMKRFSVSRSTIRQALRTLVDDGLLEKQHGKGTFVSLKPVNEFDTQIIFLLELRTSITRLKLVKKSRNMN